MLLQIANVLFMLLVILVFEGYCWRLLLKLAHSACHCSTSTQSRTHVTRPASPSTPPVKNTMPSSGTKRPGGEDTNPLSQHAQRQGASTGLLYQGASTSLSVSPCRRKHVLPLSTLCFDFWAAEEVDVAECEQCRSSNLVHFPLRI